MPKLTDENIAKIRRLNEIATDIRVGKVTLEQGEAEVQSILDDFTNQDNDAIVAMTSDRAAWINKIINATGNEADNLRAMHWTDIASQYNLTDDEAKHVHKNLR